jgi:hypothetical protein
MTEETLRQLLARVHERLSSSSTVDPDARDLLATVMRDIDSALGKGPVGAPAAQAAAAGTRTTTPVPGTTTPGTPQTATPAPGTATPGTRAAIPGSSPTAPVTAAPVSPEARVATATPRLEILEALAVKFEAEHPAIAQLLRQIGTLLGQAGI